MVGAPGAINDDLSPHKEVLCAKCEHLNPARLDTCSSCGAHLYIACHACGRRNRRVNSQCLECGRKLHRAWWRRWKSRNLNKSAKTTLLEGALFIVVVLLVFEIIVKLSEFRLVNGL